VVPATVQERLPSCTPMLEVQLGLRRARLSATPIVTQHIYYSCRKRLGGTRAHLGDAATGRRTDTKGDQDRQGDNCDEGDEAQCLASGQHAATAMAADWTPASVWLPFREVGRDKASTWPGS
jgi:hypothetical protein